MKTDSKCTGIRRDDDQTIKSLLLVLSTEITK